MSTPVLDQKIAYRRGLVLGFTMAEVTIMVLFCLLLASAFLLDEKEKELESAKESLAELSDVSEIVRSFTSNYKDGAQIDNIFTELRLLKGENKKLKQEAVEQVKAVEAVEKDAELLKQVKQAVYEEGQREPTPPEVAAIVRAGLKKGDSAIQCERDAIETTRLKGQLANAQATLIRLGKGTEMPACWANPKTGRPEYIFSVELTSSGLIVHDEKLQHRQAEQSLLPLKDITFDSEVSPDTFRQQTTHLWAWSKDHQCRFFVMVRDKTQATEKDVYKTMLRTLEEHFYKLEIK